jgi:hypothetical protein
MNEEDEDVGFEFEPLIIEEEEKEKDCEPPKECKKKENILKIIPFPTNKKDIEQRPFMKEDIIPRHSSSVIFNGRSGSGKSNLLINLLSRPEFYGRTKPKDEKSQYFDLIFLFSPTADGGDDLVRFLKIPEKRIFTHPDTKVLDNILKTQKDFIAEKGLEKSPKILIIFEDIQSNNGRIMNSPSFLKCFIQARHLNVSTWLLGQSFTRTPRACRLQANNIFMFPSSGSEIKILVEEFCPPHTDKKTFQKLIEHATKEQYNFLHINMRQPPEKRFRKNLDTILKIKN